MRYASHAFVRDSLRDRNCMFELVWTPALEAKGENAPRIESQVSDKFHAFTWSRTLLSHIRGESGMRFFKNFDHNSHQISH